MSTVKANTIEPASGGTVTITGAALTTPALGTAASGTLTNCTGLPASTGLSGTTLASSVVNASLNAITPTGGSLAVHGEVTFQGSQLNFEPGIGVNAELINRVGAGFEFYVDNATKLAMTLDTSGNLGLGVTPSAWNTGFKTLQVSNFGVMVSPYNGNTYQLANAYLDAVGYKYLTTAPALRQEMESGKFTWSIAPSGTAGDAISFTQAMSLEASGNLLVGTTTSSGRLSIKASGTATYAATFYDSTNTFMSGFYVGASGITGGYNGANCVQLIAKDATTSRSINAGGTINASGADYAEYERNNGTKFVKGQIVGFKEDGTLTDVYSDAIRFGVKSTNPGLVGGDSWGHQDQIGRRPDEPVYIAPEYRGAADPGPEPVEPIAPDAPPEIPPSLPLDEGADDESRIQYAAAQMQIRAKVMQAAEQYKHAVEAHEVAHAKWLLDKAAWDAAAYTYRMEQRQHKETAEVAKDLFDNTTMPEYRRALEAFEQRLEAERQLVDRIAYSGKVPCNVQGATPGDYIVAVNDGSGGIKGLPVRNPTFEQYRAAVGRVNRILPDGRAEIAVIVH